MEPPLAKLQHASTALLLGFGLGMGAHAQLLFCAAHLAARVSAPSRAAPARDCN
jgi:hypothetical protein